MLFKIIMLVILTDESMGIDFLLETASRKKKKRAWNRCRIWWTERGLLELSSQFSSHKECVFKGVIWFKMIYLHLCSCLFINSGHLVKGEEDHNQHTD